MELLGNKSTVVDMTDQETGAISREWLAVSRAKQECKLPVPALGITVVFKHFDTCNNCSIFAIPYSTGALPWWLWPGNARVPAGGESSFGAIGAPEFGEVPFSPTESGSPPLVPQIAALPPELLPTVPPGEIGLPAPPPGPMAEAAPPGPGPTGNGTLPGPTPETSAPNVPPLVPFPPGAEFQQPTPQGPGPQAGLPRPISEPSTLVLLASGVILVLLSLVFSHLRRHRFRGGYFLCAGHVRQLGSGSLLPNLIEVKG